MNKKKKLLFITRNYPPQVGGMEKYSSDFYITLKDIIEVDLLKNSDGKWFLPFFFIRSFFFILLYGHRYTHIHFGDAVLTPLVLVAKLTTSAKTSCTVHGLDVIYDNAAYQFIVARCLARMDKVVAVSRYTLNQCVIRGIDPGRCYHISNGIRVAELVSAVSGLEDVLARYKIDAAGKKILFSIGRLIKRKGILWFVENVMPMLATKYIYLIAGDGPEYEMIAAAVSRAGLVGQVHLLGRITDNEKCCLYKYSECYIMPNIPVVGDAEGFGITIIEAAAYGLPSIAADIEGIPDAVLDRVTGTLVPPGNAVKYMEAIDRAKFDRDRIARYARETYDWSVLKMDYVMRIFT